MPEIYDLPPLDNESPSIVGYPEKNDPTITFADLVMDHSLLPVSITLRQTEMSTKQFLESELLTALQCEV